MNKISDNDIANDFDPAAGESSHECFRESHDISEVGQQKKNPNLALNKATYLVIGHYTWPGREFLDAMLKTVSRRDIAVARNSQSILAHSARYPECTRLVNLNCVSGFGGAWLIPDGNGGSYRSLPVLQRDRWVDHIQFREKSEFSWAHPKVACEETCRSDYHPQFRFHAIPQAEVKPKWKVLTHYHAQPPLFGISFEEVRAAVIVCGDASTANEEFEWFSGFVEFHKLELLDCLPERFLTAQYSFL